MKLYFYDYYNGKINKSIKEVDETPKTYKEFALNRRIIYKKSDIGKVTMLGTRVFMVDDDFEKARKIFVDYLKNKIDRKEREIREIQEEILRINCDIERLKKQED